MSHIMNNARRIAATLLAMTSLTGCMAAPAQRESREGLDPRRACLAQCNRDNNICMDQQSARPGNTSQVGRTDYGMGATCKAELQSCQARC